MDTFKVGERVTFMVGDKVMFGRRHGEQTLGEVVGVNRTRLKLKQLDTRGTYKDYPVGSLWVVPFTLCRRVEGAAATAGAAPPARSEAAIMEDIRRIYSHLSPENLSCDGELSRSQVFRRRVALEARLRACFKEFGREVDEGEAYAAAEDAAARTRAS